VSQNNEEQGSGLFDDRDLMVDKDVIDDVSNEHSIRLGHVQDVRMAVTVDWEWFVDGFCFSFHRVIVSQLLLIVKHTGNAMIS
jgi:hypothetical protein